MGSVVDIEAILNSSPDYFSRILSKFAVSAMDLEHLNIFYESLPLRVGDSNFASTVLDSLKISRLVKGSSFPSRGPVIAIVPVISGILEVLTAISEIIEHSTRQDIKILPTSKVFRSFDFFSPYFLSSFNSSSYSLLVSAINHLKNGGALIYFVRINSIKSSIDSSVIFPYKLSKLTNSALVNLLIDYDDNLKFSWSTFLGHWVYFFFSIRRFFANSETSVLTIFGNPFFCEEINIKESYVKHVFTQFFSHHSNSFGEKSVFIISSKVKKLYNQLVSRGTK